MFRMDRPSASTSLPPIAGYSDPLGTPSPEPSPPSRPPFGRWDPDPGRPGRDRPPTDPARPLELSRRPVSAIVYGASRPLVHLALYALAHATNPEFVWVEVRVPGEIPHRLDPVTLGWVPQDRVITIDHTETQKADAAAPPSAISSMIAAEGSGLEFARVAEYLRLPDSCQRILSDGPADGQPGLVAVTDAQRLRAAYTPSRVPPLLSLHISAGYSIFIGFADAAGPDRMLFDYVFRLDGESAHEWRDSSLTCEKGDSSGPLRVGHSVRLPQIGFLEKTFERALPDGDD